LTFRYTKDETKWIILKYVKQREGVLLNERGKYNISDARRKECDKRGCKIGSGGVISF
jgi:hypothetical protein